MLVLKSASAMALVLMLSESSFGFRPASTSRLHTRSSFLGMSPMKDPKVTPEYNPLNIPETSFLGDNEPRKSILGGGIVGASAVSVLSMLPQEALSEVPKFSLSSGTFDPSKFQPVCSASDGFYRFLQSSTQAVVGAENFYDYGPLIAGGLLRIRLELCVVESFFNEAVGPFIQQNGVSWILPLHETVETFLAGVVFSLATTFILVGSTKILTVIITYADFLVGFPCRFLGGFAFDRARGKPVTLDIGFGPFKTRIVGPKDYVKDDAKKFDYEVDLSKTNPANFAVVLLSGSVKITGQTVGVSCLGFLMRPSLAARLYLYYLPD